MIDRDASDRRPMWRRVLTHWKAQSKAYFTLICEKCARRLFRVGHPLMRFIDREIPFSRHPDYYRWLRKNYPRRAELAQMAEESAALAAAPLISVVMPVYDPPLNYLRTAIESVRAQAYPFWELCIVDDCSQSNEVRKLLCEYARADERIRLQRNDKNYGIAESSNRACSFARGEYLALLDHDDALTPDALYQIAKAHQRHLDAELIYSDEDKIDDREELSGPFFKPDWCPDSFLSRMYICHLSVIARSTFERLGGFRGEYEGGHLYDFVLRLSDESTRIVHVPKILYHWRLHPNSSSLDASVKSYVFEADHKALQHAVDRRGEPGEVIKVPGHTGFYIVRYQIREPKKISIIIPSRDFGDMLDRCLSSVFGKSTYTNYEVLLVDNGTTEAEALAVFKKWQSRESERFRILPLDIPFNFSTLSNYGASKAEGEYLLFLNNDTEVLTEDWIEAMLEQAQRPAIGAVGALLLYENGHIQHAGAILGLGGVAAHSHRGCARNDPGYMGQVISINNYLSVAASCMMCRKELFVRHGGFDERLPGDYEDLDFCLKLIESGYRNVYLPHVVLYHYEQATRGRYYAFKKPVEQHQSFSLIVSKWRKYIEHDPCYNPNLTRSYEDYRLRV